MHKEEIIKTQDANIKSSNDFSWEAIFEPHTIILHQLEDAAIISC